MTAKLTISLTETPHFRRLVDFLEDVDSYARIVADEDLAEIVTEARSDLLGLCST